MEKDRDLFWKSIEPEHVRARGFCRKLMGNREDGDDLYQDSLVAALTKFSSLRDITSFRPWLYRIAVNTYKNRVRRMPSERHQSLTAEMQETVAGENPVGLYAARRRLERAFSAVSSQERALITLFELEGWSIAELASLLGKTEGNIKVRLSRARRKMREKLARFLPSTDAQQIVKPVERKDDVCVATKPGEN